MKKKITSIFTMIVMLISCICCFPVSAGAVSKNSSGVYEIATAQDLVDFATIVNSGETKANAIITADIDMAGINFDPIGTYSDYDGVRGRDCTTIYRGNFDGNGFIISNLTINTSEKIETGLFSRVQGIIKNVNVKDARITNNSGIRAGIIAGEIEGGKVINCCVTGTVSTGHKQKGGIAGEGYDAKVINCYSSFEPLINKAGDYGNIDNSFCSNKLFVFEGGGTKENPYKISNNDDLFQLSNTINNSEYGYIYNDDYYLQTADIDLNNEQFTPIGKYFKDGIQGSIPNFIGHYNGNGYTIKNLYVDELDKFAGLFGSSVGIIENLEVHGNINSKGVSTGGIVGEIGANAIVRNCCFFGDVTSGDFATGGIVGYIWQSGTVENCYHSGNVKSNGSAGGIAGRICSNIESTADENSVIVRNSYNIGSVSGFAGAIIGYVDFYDNVINSVTIKNCYSLKDDGNDIINGNCPSYETKSLTVNEMRNAADIISNQLISNPIPSFNNGYPIFEWQLDDAEESKPINIPFVGSGIKEDPYQIATIEDLILLSEVTNNKSIMDYFSKCHYIQTTDIDLNNKIFTPIAINCDFEGTYNGNYHKIINLKISTSKNFTGLFSKVTEGGCISKLSVEGKVNSSGDNVGGIAGSLTDSASIANCDYHGTVTGSDNVGALVGLAENDVTIESCYSDAKITGKSSIGGLIGSIHSALNGSKVSKLYFSGTVSCDNTEQGSICGTVSDDKLEMNMVYFLSSICSGNAINNESAIGCTKLSATALKACADMLGSPFTINSSSLYEGYPIFEWQSTPYQFKGSGTEGNPYKISTKIDLENLRDLINSSYYNQFYSSAYFVQTADIDLENESWIPIASSNSNQTFKGTYDGSCHYINGLNVDTSFEYAGLFGMIDGADIHDIVINGTITQSRNASGGVAGIATNNSKLEKCAFVGDVSAESAAGGVLGILKNGSNITNCYHNGAVSSNSYAGGLIGSVTFDDKVDESIITVQNCYQANGIVNGKIYSGCIVGNCAINSGSSNIVSILNCFATTDADAITNQANATKDNTLIVTKSMLKKSSEDLSDFFIDNTSTQLNDGYPVFTWQIKSDIVGDVNNDWKFNISDAVMMQKWLLCTEQMTTWENGDLCKDGIIDVFDLCLMRRKLIYD